MNTSHSSTAGLGPEPASAQPIFLTTHWSVVLTAGRNDTARAQAALERLCRTYWLPLYLYVRRRGYSIEDAQDLTQEFFRRFLERRGVAAADPNRGRFRSFLLASLKYFLADEWDRARAQKRGKGQVISLDYSSAETQLLAVEAAEHTPERIYERRWAMTLLTEVYQRLEAEQRGQGKEAAFTVLRDTLAGDREAQPYADLARQLGVSEGAARVTAHRLRQRYREILREVIAETVAEPGQVEDELRHLIQILAG